MIKGVEDMRWLTLNTKWIRINSKVGVPMAPVFSVRESLASLHGRNQIQIDPVQIPTESSKPALVDPVQGLRMTGAARDAGRA